MEAPTEVLEAPVLCFSKGPTETTVSLRHLGTELELCQLSMQWPRQHCAPEQKPSVAARLSFISER